MNFVITLMLVMNSLLMFTGGNYFPGNFKEAIVQSCSVKKVFLEISQNAQEKHLGQSLFLNEAEGISVQLY